MTAVEPSAKWLYVSTRLGVVMLPDTLFYSAPVILLGSPPDTAYYRLSASVIAWFEAAGEGIKEQWREASGSPRKKLRGLLDALADTMKVMRGFAAGRIDPDEVAAACRGSVTLPPPPSVHFGVIGPPDRGPRYPTARAANEARLARATASQPGGEVSPAGPVATSVSAADLVNACGTTQHSPVPREECLHSAPRVERWTYAAGWHHCPHCGGHASGCKVRDDGLRVWCRLDRVGPFGWQIQQREWTKWVTDPRTREVYQRTFRFFLYAIPPDRPAVPPPEPEPVPCDDQVRGYAGWMTPEIRTRLAADLRLPAFVATDLLLHQAVGFVGFRAGRRKRRGVGSKPDGYTFGERDNRGGYVGYNIRFCGTSDKEQGAGTARGLTYADDLDDAVADAVWTFGGPAAIVPDAVRGRRRHLVFLCEGASDWLALRAAGVRAVIARPSVNGGRKYLVRMFRRRADVTLVVIGENDGALWKKVKGRRRLGVWPGRAKALHFAKRLATEIGRPVLFALTPDGLKDPRGWLVARACGDESVDGWARLGTAFARALLAPANVEWVSPGPPRESLPRTERWCPDSSHFKLKGRPGGSQAGMRMACSKPCGHAYCRACADRRANRQVEHNRKCLTRWCDPRSFPRGDGRFARKEVPDATGNGCGPSDLYFAVLTVAERTKVLRNIGMQEKRKHERLHEYRCVPLVRAEDVGRTAVDGELMRLCGADGVNTQPVSTFTPSAPHSPSSRPFNPNRRTRPTRYLLVIALRPVADVPAGLRRASLPELLSLLTVAEYEWADHLVASRGTTAEGVVTHSPDEAKRSSSTNWRPEVVRVTSGNWDADGASILKTASAGRVAIRLGIRAEDAAVGGSRTSVRWSGASLLGELFGVCLSARWWRDRPPPTEDEVYDRVRTLAEALDGVALGESVRAAVCDLIPQVPSPDDRRRIEAAAEEDRELEPARRAQRDAAAQARRVIAEYADAVVEWPEGMAAEIAEANRRAGEDAVRRVRDAAAKRQRREKAAAKQEYGTRDPYRGVDVMGTIGR